MSLPGFCLRLSSSGYVSNMETMCVCCCCLEAGGVFFHCKGRSGWHVPFPLHRIARNFYDVGSSGLASYVRRGTSDQFQSVSRAFLRSIRAASGSGFESLTGNTSPHFCSSLGTASWSENKIFEASALVAEKLEVWVI
jgi:hypothetical protein